MPFFQDLDLNPATVSIDWDLTPADTFGMFESWGGKERVRNRRERFYYFYIENWKDTPRLSFMERGIKYARVLAKINAPRDMLDRCIREQGSTRHIDTSYAINEEIKLWLQKNVINTNDSSLLLPFVEEKIGLLADTGLPTKDDAFPEIERIELRTDPCGFNEEHLEIFIRQKNLFDAHYNPQGKSVNFLMDNKDGETITDLATGLMWQRDGCDINSIRTIQRWVAELNESRFAGYDDWRLPTTLEGLTLIERERNGAGLHLHPCFSPDQPFIFTADQCKPGGHWYIDFTKGSAFWASGFNPGGFGRVCRNI